MEGIQTTTKSVLMKLISISKGGGKMTIVREPIVSVLCAGDMRGSAS